MGRHRYNIWWTGMIYLLTNPSTKEKTIIVSKLTDLPQDSICQMILRKDRDEYHVNGVLFSNILTMPINSTPSDIINVMKYQFSKDILIKQFETKDFFQSYLIYTMSTL